MLIHVRSSTLKLLRRFTMSLSHFSLIRNLFWFLSLITGSLLIMIKRLSNESSKSVSLFREQSLVRQWLGQKLTLFKQSAAIEFFSVFTATLRLFPGRLTKYHMAKRCFSLFYICVNSYFFLTKLFLIFSHSRNFWFSWQRIFSSRTVLLERLIHTKIVLFSPPLVSSECILGTENVTDQRFLLSCTPATVETRVKTKCLKFKLSKLV